MDFTDGIYCTDRGSRDWADRLFPWAETDPGIIGDRRIGSGSRDRNSRGFRVSIFRYDDSGYDTGMCGYGCCVCSGSP